MKSTNLLRLCVVLAVALFAVASADMANAGLFGGRHGGCKSSCGGGGFFAGLRDRGGDCCEAEPVCCEEEPVCCEPAPVCEPAPCCEPAPVCEEPAPCCEAEPCCETECCDSGRKHGGCLKGLFGGLRNRGGDCCEATCDSGCGC